MLMCGKYIKGNLTKTELGGQQGELSWPIPPGQLKT